MMRNDLAVSGNAHLVTMNLLRRSYSKKASALSERFQQILDEQISSSTHSLISSNPDLDNIYKNERINDAKHASEAEQKAFEQKYQREIGFVQSQSRHGNLRLEVPWDGTEKVTDTAQRMLLDSLPKAKPTKYQATIFTPAVALKDRIEGAKEGALDYKIKPTDKEKEDFRELYKERLLGPSMFVDTLSPKSTLGLIGGLADLRINAAINRKTGKFESSDMDSVRGKPLDKARLANCLDTDFFLNEILNKQECLPPWIENQQGIDRDIRQFRNDLHKTLFTMMLDILRSKCGNNDDRIKEFMAKDSIVVRQAVSLQYLEKHSSYFSSKVRDLNRGVRNYNLQCPTGALHKWKLVENKELADRLEQLTQEFPNLFEEYVKKRDFERLPSPQKSFISKLILGPRTSLWGLLRGMFKR